MLALSKKATNQINKYLFDVNDYKISGEIKRGGCAVISLVKNKSTGALYAAKTNIFQSPKQNKHFISREVRILVQVQHPTIIKFQGFSFVDFDDKKNITILMDYMKNGSLADLIAKECKGLSSSNYDNTKKQIILIGIARGMMLLHKLHIIHRDLKPENILLDDDLYPHITDFGLSKFFDPNHSMSQSMAEIGTVAYMAPEVIKDNRFNTKADVYSFGILMYELLTGKRAYRNLLYGKKKLSIFQFNDKIVHEGLRPTIEEGTMKKSHQIMIEKCLLENPKERPTFSELYKKLGLFSEDSFLEFDCQTEPDVINYEDDENNVEDDEIGIDKTFCLDDVDYDEVLCYVNEVNEEPISNDQNEEIEQMKKTIDELKAITKAQSSKISELNSKLSEQTEINEKMMKTINELKEQIDNQHDENIDPSELETLKLREEFSKEQEKTHIDPSEIETIKNDLSKVESIDPILSQIQIDLRCIKYELKRLKELSFNESSTSEDFTKLEQQLNDYALNLKRLENQVSTLCADFQVTNFNVKKLTKAASQKYKS